MRPIFVKPRKTNFKYEIKDNFLNFWFHFIFKFSNYVELGEFKQLQRDVGSYFTMYSKRFLKKYFLEKMEQEDEFTTIGTYWEKDNIKVIDIVAVNDLKKLLVFADVKLNKERIRLSKLEKRSEYIRSKFPDYQVKYIGLSLEDM